MSSAELARARSQISAISSYLKQGKLLPAITALHESLVIVIRNPLMKSEKDEFNALLEQAVFWLSQDKELKTVYPLLLDFKPGHEKDLLSTVRTILEELHATVADEAKQSLADRDKRKREGLEIGQGFIDRLDFDQAKRAFDKLTKEFREDTDLRAEVADRFMAAGRYTEAFDYLDKALKDNPQAVHLYNRIGIVLRRMRDFETAERYYKKALEINRGDANLFFNLGRVYVDWGQWLKAAESAQKALDITPEFEEAKKMMTFAYKKIGIQQD